MQPELAAMNNICEKPKGIHSRPGSEFEEARLASRNGKANLSYDDKPTARTST